MADPLSVVASIIAVVSAVDTACKTLAKVRSLRNASTEILALNNEVANLRVTFTHLDTYIRFRLPEKSDLLHAQLLQLSTALDRAKTQVLALETLLQYRFITSEPTDGKCKVSGLRWIRAKNTVENLQKNLRNHRMEIVTQLTAINACKLDEVLLISGQTQASLFQNSVDTIQQLDRNFRLLTDISNTQQDIRLMDRSDRSLSTGSQASVCSSSKLNSDQSADSIFRMKGYLQKRQTSHCAEYCRCLCHNSYGFNSPQALDHFLGALVFGYSGRPLQRCTAKSCKRKSDFRAHANYYFPSWLLRRMLSCVYTLSNELSISLTIRNLVPASAEIFRLILLDDVDGLRRLFASGCASPNDLLYPIGTSALQYAVTDCRLNACKALLDAGADPHLENAVNCSAHSWSWDTILQASEDPETLETLRGLFPDNDSLDERQFSKIHKIVLGMVSHDLEEELDLCGTSLDAQDSKGRTTLSWAVERGDVKSTSLLLKAQADLELSDIRNHTPLLYACGAPNSNCAKLLLEAGVDFNHTNNSQMNALHCAVGRQDNEQMVEDLIAAGVNINVKNVWGSTPLAHAVATNRPLVTKILLDHGAAIDIPDYEGDTALLNSLHIGADNITQLLLERGASYNSANYTGNTVLHLAAKAGGLKTIDVLDAACLSDIDVDAINNQEQSALQLAQHRDEEMDGFVDRFQALLASIRKREEIVIDMHDTSSHSSSEEGTPSNDTEYTEWDDFFVDAPEDPLEKE